MFKIKIKQRSYVLALVITLFFTVITNQAHAQSIESGFTWKITYLSDKTKCQINDKRYVQDIAELTEKYFKLYKIDNQKFENRCLFYEEFLDKSISDNTDLNIIIFDEQAGKKSFLKHGYNGLYAHFGSDRMQNHVIMIAKPPQFNSAYENIEFSWSLSEKLSYFIFSYYGHNVESIIRMAHTESEYEECMEETKDKKCDKNITIIHSNVSGDKYNVKSPSNEIVNQKSMKYLPDELYTSKVVKDIVRKTTGWWLNGLIDEQMYLEIIKQIVDVSVKNNNEIDSTQLFISNGFSIVDKAKSNTNTDVITYIPIENEFYTVLNYIPFDTNIITLESEHAEIPSWFKNRAIIWHDEKMGDKIFLDGLTALIQNGAITGN